jgi:hypothetical protein
MAFLRSDSDDEQQQQHAHSRQGSLHLDQQGSLPGGSHPSRSRFFDVPSAEGQPPPPPPQQQHGQQPGTPSAGADGSVLGRKLTFDQFKAAAAGGNVNPAAPPPPPEQQQQQQQGHVPGKALTMAELEHQMSGGPGQPPPPPANQPPPPPGVFLVDIAAACRVVVGVCRTSKQQGVVACRKLPLCSTTACIGTFVNG